MTQQDVLKLLKNFPEDGLTSKEIRNMLNDNGVDIGLGTVSVNLRRLRKKGGFVVMYYPNTKKNPKYILKKYATKKIMSTVEEVT